MAGSTTSTSAGLLSTIFQPGVTETAFMNSELLKAFPIVPAAPGSTINWTISEEGTNNATSIAEDASLPAASTRLDAAAQVSKVRYVDVGQVSHDLQDYSDPAKLSDVLVEEVRRTVLKVVDEMNTAELAVFEAAIGSASSYAGLTRSSYSDSMVSYVESTSTALQVEQISTMVRTLMDANRGIRAQDLVIYSAATLAEKYAKASNNSFDGMRSQFRMQGDSVDGGFGFAQGGLKFDGVIDWVILPEMTSTTLICGPQKNPAFRCELHATRQPTISQLAKTDLSDKFAVDAVINLICKAPGKWGKLTNKS